MSQKNKQGLKQTNQQNFPNNNSAFITPEKLRDFNNDIIDSMAIDVDTQLSGSISITGSINISNNVSASEVSASTYYGDGSNLTGVTAQPPAGTISGSSQVILTDTTGNLGGNRITGSVSNATTASYALTSSEVYVDNQPNFNQEHYIAWVNNSGFDKIKIDATNLKYNSSTNILDSVYFRGDLIGNADTATSASQSTSSSFSQTSISSSHAEVADFALSASFSNAQTVDVGIKGDNREYSLLFATNSGEQDIYIDQQKNILYNPSGNRLTVSHFQGQLTGNADTSTTASYAITASYALNAGVSDWSEITNKPSGLVSGSSQIDLGLAQGTASFAVSASYAVSASVEIIKEISSSYADHTEWSGIYNIPSGLVSGSSQIVLEDVTYTDNGVDSFLTTDGAGNLSFDYVRSLYQNIRNMEATPILKGTPLFVSGATGDNANVYIADADNPLRRPATLIAGDATLAPAATGKGLVAGKIENVDTNAYPPGTEVYLGAGGGWTATRPTGSAQVQLLGVVTRQGNNGHGVFINQLQAVLPNIQSGYAWVGDGDGVPQAVATSSFAVSIDTGSLATTGSNTFVGDQYIQGNVTSSINKSNLIVNPQTINDNITVGPDSNGFVVGPVTFGGSTTLEGDSELYVFSPPPLGEYVTTSSYQIDSSSFDSRLSNVISQTGSYATLGANNFTATQTISGSLNIAQTGFNSEIKFTSGSRSLLIGTSVPNGDYLSIDAPNADGGYRQAIQISMANGWQEFYQTTNINGNLNARGFTTLREVEQQSTYTASLERVELNTVMKLSQQDPLPAGAVGELAVSGSNLYFHNGTNWTQIN